MTTAAPAPAAQHTIECVGCHHDYDTKRPNTKRCNICRLAEDVAYMRTRTYTCYLCDARFSPLGRGDSCCADCTHQPTGAGEAACVYCGNTALRVTAGVDVCHRCARDPEQRKKFARGLRDKVQRRRQEATT